MSNQVSAVVFDMDDVMCHYRFDVRLAEIARHCDRTSEQVEAAIWTSGFDEDGDRGRYDGQEYLAEFNRRLDSNLTLAQWIDARRRATVPNLRVLALARALAERMPVALLTNNGPLFKAGLAEIYPQAAELFGDRAYCAYEFGGAKPSAQVFEGVARALALPPRALLFIDDTPAYLAGAQSVGLATHHFTGAEGLRNELAARDLL